MEPEKKVVYENLSSLDKFVYDRMSYLFKRQQEETKAKDIKCEVKSE